MEGSEMAPDQGRQREASGEGALRQLARRAIGLSGADVERLVRVARQRARREQRPLTWRDLDQLLSAARPTMSTATRRRVAVHEAGHMLARILLDLGTLTVVTIDGPNGGFTEALLPDDHLETEQRCQDLLVVIMAGRAAEQVIYGSAIAGSGGHAHSDLARATQLAATIETSLGFGRRMRLLYRDPDQWQAMIRQDGRLARIVHRRLDDAEASARRLVRRHLAQLEKIADALEAGGTLEGTELAELAETVRASVPAQ
jgi:ATP-dependent Zn protease